MTDRGSDVPLARPPGDEEPIASTRCEMGDLLLFADRLSFRGSPVLERLGHGQPDRDVALRRVIDIEWRKPSFFHMGRLGLVLEPAPGERTATIDFAFQTWERAAFEAFRDELERGVAAARARAEPAAEETAHSAGAVAGPPGVAAPDIPDQIRRLAELRDEGILTAEEFESKKRELLARM